MLSFVKPQKSNLQSIRKILSQWNDLAETDKYIARVENEILGQSEFNMCFWVLKLEDKVIGMGCLADCQPKLKPFISSENSRELKAIYLDKNFKGRGYGKVLINNLENKAKQEEYDQLLLLSASKYADTAYGFYEKLGFKMKGSARGGSLGKVMAVFSKEL